MSTTFLVFAALSVVAIILVIVYRKITARRREESAQAGLWFIDSIEANIALFEKNAIELASAADSSSTLVESQKAIADIYVELTDLDQYQESWPAKDEELIQDFSGLDVPAALQSLANLRQRLNDCREQLKQCIQDQIIKHNSQGFDKA